MTDLIERLEEEAQRLSGHSLDHGSVDAGIASNLASEAASELSRLQSALQEAEERAAQAEAAEDEAKDCFWAIYPDWCEMKGHGIGTEAARSILLARAEKAEKERDEAVKALEPFALQSKAFDDAADQMGFARSDDMYRPHTSFTHVDLRRARTLSHLREETK